MTVIYPANNAGLLGVEAITLTLDCSAHTHLAGAHCAPAEAEWRDVWVPPAGSGYYCRYVDTVDTGRYIDSTGCCIYGETI